MWAGGGMLAGEGVMCTMVTPHPTDSRESVLKVSDSLEENLDNSENSDAELTPLAYCLLDLGRE